MVSTRPGADYVAPGKNISVRGINITLWVIYLLKKKSSYSTVLESVRKKMLCLKFNLEAVCQTHIEIASIKIF
jgi:hypothetical protein